MLWVLHVFGIDGVREFLLRRGVLSNLRKVVELYETSGRPVLDAARQALSVLP